MEQEQKKSVEWHPAFSASIQIEFEKETERLSFESEHELSKKPMRIDELIIKVKGEEPIRKNIGRIFRKHNIIEYKGPEDNLTINDFYKVYGYCCFYQSDTDLVCEIKPQELTITFICNHYPKKMIQHLEDFQKLRIEYVEPGIYYFKGSAIPMQLIITKELDKEENRWLRSLRTDIREEDELEALIQSYEKKKDSKLYQAVMDAVTRANWAVMKEVKSDMCEALKELMAEEFQELEEQVTERVTEQVTERVTEQVTEQVTNRFMNEKKETAKSLAEEGMLPAKIAQILKVSAETVGEWLAGAASPVK